MRRVSLLFVVLLISACSATNEALPTLAPTLPLPTATPTLVPSNTATLTPQATATLTATSNRPTPIPSETPVLVDPLLSVSIAPPISIDLPEGWQFGYDTFLFQDIDGNPDTVPFALYQGPVTGGTGTIILAWGFDSVTTGNQFSEEFGQRNIWLDGLRILRTVILDGRCNIGNAPQRDYTVGNRPATGNTINVTDCPDEQPNTRGWFAALIEGGVNFAFYVLIDPLPPAGHPAEDELQAVLDSVEFNVDEMTVSQEELFATQQALELTITPPTPASP